MKQFAYNNMLNKYLNRREGYIRGLIHMIAQNTHQVTLMLVKGGKIKYMSASTEVYKIAHQNNQMRAPHQFNNYFRGGLLGGY
jgi:hypothetical protein